MSGGLEAAYAYCGELTRQEAKNFYYGFRLLPNGQRRAIYSAYAFARQADDIVDAGLPPVEAAAGLSAYRSAFERCLAGGPDGPVFEALAHTIEAYNVPTEYFFELLSGCEADLEPGRRYETFDALKEYCQHVASAVGLISIEIFGYRQPERARRHAAELGIALQLTNILRDIQEDAERGRVYLPQDEIEWFGYSEKELREGRVTADFRRLMAYQIDRAREYFRQGRKLLPLLPTRARACVGVMAGIYASILDDIERNPAVVYRERVSLSTSQKLALAGRELVRSVVG